MLLWTFSSTSGAHDRAFLPVCVWVWTVRAREWVHWVLHVRLSSRLKLPPATGKSSRGLDTLTTSHLQSFSLSALCRAGNVFLWVWFSFPRLLMKLSRCTQPLTTRVKPLPTMAALLLGTLTRTGHRTQQQNTSLGISTRVRKAEERWSIPSGHCFLQIKLSFLISNFNKFAKIKIIWHEIQKEHTIWDSWTDNPGHTMYPACSMSSTYSAVSVEMELHNGYST